MKTEFTCKECGTIFHMDLKTDQEGYAIYRELVPCPKCGKRNLLSYIDPPLNLFAVCDTS